MDERQEWLNRQRAQWDAPPDRERDRMADAYDRGYKAGRDAAAAPPDRETLAAWMIEHGYATGHGDTTADLLHELEWQIAAAATPSLPLDVDHIEMILDLSCGYCEGRLGILRNGHLLTPQEGGPPPEYEECTDEVHDEGRAEQVLTLLARLDEGSATPDPENRGKA